MSADNVSCRTVSVGPQALNCLDHGSGPPLLLVHGFPLDHAMWQAQFDVLASRWRVIAPDLRGFGASRTKSPATSLEQLADDLAGLLDALAVNEPVVYCGLSMGGYIAWSFWQRHRARLRGLILCDTRAAADTPETARGRLVTAEQVLSSGAGGLIEAMVGRLFAAATSREHPELVAGIRQVMQQTAPATIAAALRAMAARPDSTPLLREIFLPALLIVGEDDVITPVKEMREMAQLLPAARLAVIPGAGHMAPLEQPAAVNRELLAYLDSLA